MRHRFTRPAGRITLTYLVIALLWIAFSDRAAEALFADPQLLNRVQTIKGGFFVLATGLLLYILMHRTLHRIEIVALEDSLTGLPNRLAFTRELALRCQTSLARDQRFTLTLMDIDHFTDLNDEQGHARGDELLIMTGQQLRRLLDRDWYIAHMGGDEFGLLSPPGLSIQETRERLDWLQHAVMRGSEHDLMLNHTLSAGSCEFPKDARTGQDMLRQADMALSRAKHQGRDRHSFYHEELKRTLLERLSLAKDLRDAVEQRAFTLVYQPQWSVSTSRWVGAEVLVRWHHAERGWVPPDQFIPLAEREGMIHRVTECVVEKTLTELNQAGLDRAALPSLSINLSHLTLLHDNTMSLLHHLIDQRADNLPAVMFEITETATMENLDRTLSAMQEWQLKGIDFSIDDFGTGYSSLSRLKQLPLKELKIDRSFIMDLPADQNDAVITQAILAMAKTLSLNVVAEGVETLEQSDFLQTHGCTIMQGYYYARPMPIEALTARLTEPVNEPTR
ncbi:putative bifunctional diguanylate cyclase/phosphodiesterase [Saccharospirillum impatiens]|uniref:putative bifunctional diguanylate cyclase/phosphodiesterase n=1 Tax=Saccharospirillum impatiens TaxID=169438 RepID=UPI000423FD58|nr:bifunctional diguanylate cyclase/phosphodiesterase [Saccharospirillum impatiens]